MAKPRPTIAAAQAAHVSHAQPGSAGEGRGGGNGLGCVVAHAGGGRQGEQVGAGEEVDFAQEGGESVCAGDASARVGGDGGGGSWGGEGVGEGGGDAGDGTRGQQGRDVGGEGGDGALQESQAQERSAMEASYRASQKLLTLAGVQLRQHCLARTVVLNGGRG